MTDTRSTPETTSKSSAKRDKAAKSATASPAVSPASASPSVGPGSTRSGVRTRKARLRLVQLDAWSVMKMAFLLSVAIAIITVVAVTIVWIVLDAAGVFDSLNSTIQTVMGNSFRLQDYFGTGRVIGFSMLVSAVNVVLITAISTLAAFLYNLAATLLGGVEMTLAEDH